MSSVDPSLILRNRKGEIIFFRPKDNFAKFMNEYTSGVSVKGLGNPLRPDDDHFPVRPDASFHRREGAQGFGLFNHNDERAISDWIKADSRWTDQCVQVIGFLRAALDQQVQEQVELRVVEPWAGSRPSIRRVTAVLEQLYGGWTDIKGQRNFNEMTIIPDFTSVQTVQSGLLKIDALRLERDGWGHAPAIYDDAFYRIWLLKRMRAWPVLSILRTSLVREAALTFAQCRIQLSAVLTDEQESRDDENHRRVQQLILKDYFQQPTEPTEPRIDSSVTPLFVNRMVGDPGFKCYNCDMTSHSAKDCQELWCSKCGARFTVFGCNGYHNYTECPLWNRKRSATADAADQPPQKPRMMFQQSVTPSHSTSRAHQYYPQRGQQSTTRAISQQQQYPQRVQQPAVIPATQLSVGRKPWNPSRLRQSVPRSRFAGHAGVLDDPIYDDALEAAGVQDMSLEQAQAFSARIQSFNASAAAMVDQAQSGDESGAGGREYTQPWEHADSDF